MTLNLVQLNCMNIIMGLAYASSQDVSDYEGVLRNSDEGGFSVHSNIKYSVSNL
jgi:hypothetical protein